MYWGLNANPNNGNLPIQSYLLLIPAIGVFYLIAVICFYLGHFPEKYYPKKFDIICNSHTLWHMTSFVGFVLTYKLTICYYEDRFFLFGSV
jgi:predicted membrane channel-forming protein YqfA (hemolysin III family)